jgi:hypothetical protein
MISGSVSNGEKSEDHQYARTDRQSKLRLEQFKIFAPDYSIHPWRDVRAYAVDGK